MVSFVNSSWGDLPEELLSIIFKHLTNNYNLPDLFQCLAVCRSWRFVAKHLWLSSSVSTAPWLLLQSEQPNKIVLDTSLYKSYVQDTTDKRLLLGHKATTSLVSWQIPIDHIKVDIFASYGGWLLLGNNFVAFLYNPMSRVLIQLPPLPSRLKLQPYIGFVMSETSHTHPNCIVCVSTKPKHLAICKPAPTWYYENNSKPYMCSSPSSSWVLSEKPLFSRINIQSMIFYRKKFYTLDDDGSLFVHSKVDDVFNNNSGIRLRWPVNENKVAEGGYSINKVRLFQSTFVEPFARLVESKNGHLLMVRRKYDVDWDINTVCFNVFKLIWGKEKYHWEEISRLEETEALFVGWNDYISVSVTNDINTYKSNRIYFCDRTYNYQIWSYGYYDFGKCKTYHSDDCCVD